MAVAAISRRFPHLRLTNGAVAWRPYPVFRGLRTLPVAW
jgi:hypothetical protein